MAFLIGKNRDYWVQFLDFTVVKIRNWRWKVSRLESFHSPSHKICFCNSTPGFSVHPGLVLFLFNSLHPLHTQYTCKTVPAQVRCLLFFYFLHYTCPSLLDDPHRLLWYLLCQLKFEMKHTLEISWGKLIPVCGIIVGTTSLSSTFGQIWSQIIHIFYVLLGTRTSIYSSAFH